MVELLRTFYTFAQKLTQIFMNISSPMSKYIDARKFYSSLANMPSLKALYALLKNVCNIYHETFTHLKYSTTRQGYRY